ncbi:hypothetical protein HY967_02850, partial [Candidatus Jorgensenbacteria bacterium]|nr:hypothetical protein [Candidatus Jorgensenbacteria bacterium]
MNNLWIYRFISTSLLWMLAFLVSTTRILSIGGVNPNLVIVVVLLVVFLSGVKDRSMILSLIVFSLMAFYIMPWWGFSFGILAGVLIFITFLKRIFTGINFIDFLISILIVTLCFYGLQYIFRLGVFQIHSFIGEMFYNLILGMIG